jgi:diguanylate cyclase (GGDEF)-like protein
VEFLDSRTAPPDGQANAARTRALLMAQHARVPIYFATFQIAIVAIAIPLALQLYLLAGMGVVSLIALWATLKAIDETLEAYRLCTHLVYAVSLAALAYSIFSLGISGSLTIYSTASILLGAAYLLGTRAAIFWAIPCLILAGIDAFIVPTVQYPIPPMVTFVVRAATLGTILAFGLSFRWAHDQQAAQLRYEARTDPLTGLANRLAFDDALAQALGRARRFKRRGALIFADLDGMKSINDTFGHEMGDAFLKEIADRIRTLTRIVDTPARLGGDEFVILLSEFEETKGAEILAHRLAATICRPWRVAGQEISPAVSIGIVEFSGGDASPKALLRLADDAMYAAKRSESAQICVARCDGAIEEVF